MRALWVRGCTLRNQSERRPYARRFSLRCDARQTPCRSEFDGDFFLPKNRIPRAPLKKSQICRSRKGVGNDPNLLLIPLTRQGLVGPKLIEMIIEMRTYKTKPGKRAEFLEIFRSKSVPAHDEIGMKILGPFLSIEDSDTFFFMRGFPDLASREPMKAEFYEGELWKRELENLLMRM